MRRCIYKTVVLLRFELRQADPETAVLPLHHKTGFFIYTAKIQKNILPTNRKLKKRLKLISELQPFDFVVSRRFELRQAEPKTAVLPLHPETINRLYF